jgi:hypothetical protein
VTVFQAGQKLTAAELNKLVPAILILASPQTVSSTTPAAVLSTSVSAGTYRVNGKASVLGSQNAGQARFRFTGTATASLVLVQFDWSDATASAGTSELSEDVTALGTSTTQSLTLGTGTMIYARFYGMITFSAAGTFALSAAEGTGGDAFVIQGGAIMDLQQQVT